MQNIPGIAITSGKGGVGKTLLAVNLAIGLSKKLKVSFCDLDIRAPNAPYILGIGGKKLEINSNRQIIPYKYNENLEIFSSEHYFIDNKNIDNKRAIILPGEEIRNIVRQVVDGGVIWSKNDIFVFDLDPSTGDVYSELVKIFGKKLLKAIVVSTNDISSINDCMRSLDALYIHGIKPIGIVGNMIFDNNNDRLIELSKKFNVKYLGDIPYDNIIRIQNNHGIPGLLDSKIIDNIVNEVLGVI
jgi:ATP-binding protein involved in chromosome partitioning